MPLILLINLQSRQGMVGTTFLSSTTYQLGEIETGVWNHEDSPTRMSSTWCWLLARSSVGMSSLHVASPWELDFLTTWRQNSKGEPPHRPGGGCMILLGPQKSYSITFAIIIGLARFKGRERRSHFLKNDCELHIVTRACGVGYAGAVAFEKQSWPQTDREKKRR